MVGGLLNLCHILLLFMWCINCSKLALSIGYLYSVQIKNSTILIRFRKIFVQKKQKIFQQSWLKYVNEKLDRSKRYPDSCICCFTYLIVLYRIGTSSSIIMFACVFIGNSLTWPTLLGFSSVFEWVLKPWCCSGVQWVLQLEELPVLCIPVLCIYWHLLQYPVLVKAAL